MLKIETIKNGWTVEDQYGSVEAFIDPQDLFENLLLRLLGRASGFGGDSYGEVKLKLKP